MAPSRQRTKKRSAKDQAKRAALAKKAAAEPEVVNSRQLLQDATAQLEQGNALKAAEVAGSAYEHMGSDGRYAGAALSLLGQIHVELGDVGAARSYFVQAVGVDQDGSLPEELGGGPEKFLWLAQLSEQGGRDSVTWYERGAAVLRAQIQALTDKLDTLPHSRSLQEAAIEERKRRLAEALCAVAEVYMTDLSWEEDAEQRCEALVTEAGLLAPDMAETWQTVANVRISQTRPDDARAALDRSLRLWADLPPGDPGVPPFPTRVSLARLLMEVEMEEKAVEVVERLVSEDDSSVEVWYLGGYALYTIGNKAKQVPGADGDNWKETWRTSRRWLSQCQRLFAMEDYEDERLGEHAKELLGLITADLGSAPEDNDEDDDEWEDTDGDEDEAME